MVKVVGVRFRNAGKIYYFGPGKLDIHAGMHVIVETARGVEMGTVMTEPKGVSEEEVIQPLKPVIRIATEADEKTVAKNREKEKDAFRICLEKIAKHKLDMKLVEAEYTFDNNKLLFYFTADGRIDFRELVKDLAAVFRTRIELSPDRCRDETKIMGGNRYLRTCAVLQHLSLGICAGFHQDGKRAESFFESDQDLGCVRKTDVLPEE